MNTQKNASSAPSQTGRSVGPVTRARAEKNKQPPKLWEETYDASPRATKKCKSSLTADCGAHGECKWCGRVTNALEQILHQLGKLDKLDTIEQTVNDLKAELKQNTDDVTKLQTDVSVIDSTVSKISTDIDELRSEKTKIKQELRKMNRTFIPASESVETLKERNGRDDLPLPTPQAGVMVGPTAISSQQKDRPTIWTGVLEWHEMQEGTPREVPCKVSANVLNGEPEVKGDGWPTKLILQFLPKHIVGALGGIYLVGDKKTVIFMFHNCENLASLTRVMESGYAGCVHFTGAGMQPSACNIKVLILLYSKERAMYLGFIPNDQNGFLNEIRKVTQQQKQTQTRQGQWFPGAGVLPGQSGMMLNQ